MSSQDPDNPSGTDPSVRTRLADLLAAWPGGGALRVDAGDPLIEVVSRLDAAADAPGLFIRSGRGPQRRLTAVPRRLIAATVARLLAAHGDTNVPVGTFLDEWREPMLALDPSTTLSEAVKAAIARDPARRYDPVLIELEGATPAMIDLRVLLMAQCAALETTIQRIESERIAAEHAAEARTRFLVHMGHEIRTPMTAILGFADLLGGDTLSAPERAEHGRAVRRNADHLLQMLNELLDASKLESGKMTIEATACDPLACIDDAIAILRPAARTKGLALSRTLRSDIPGTILSDPLRLRQIMLNLMTNAIKFTEHGEVGIDIEADAPAIGRERTLTIRVCDTGPGMTAEQCREVFEGFNQADSSIARKFGGTGLGLSISRQLAELMGGTLTCSSMPGAGSTFTLVLKATPAVTNSTPAPTAPARDTSRSLDGLRILIAEDGIDNERLIRTHLARAGAEVISVLDGAAAVKVLLNPTPAAPAFDVVLMDVEMPVLDGLKATRILRARGYSRPIVAMTAHDSDSHRHLCLEAGCSDHFVKPIRRELLIDSVRRHARSAGRPVRTAA